MPDEARLNSATRAAVRLRQLRERPTVVERRQQLAVLVIAPGFAGVAICARAAHAPAARRFEHPQRAVQRAYDIRRLVRAVDCKQLAGERVDPAGESREDRDVPWLLP